jgi:acetylornithine deacetylase/succinyl-diaminopimelate desuccinylase-like protein
MGDNAIYKMLPVIDAIDKMDATLRSHEFLGQGRITVTRIGSVSPSDNAVPDECRIFIDRRVTFGDTVESVIAEIEALIPAPPARRFHCIEQSGLGGAQPHRRGLSL